MAKSAQQKFAEYLDESRETMDAVNELTTHSNEFYDGYAFAAGYLGMMLKEAIMDLPRAKREQLRNRLFSKAQECKNQQLAKTIKEA